MFSSLSKTCSLTSTIYRVLPPVFYTKRAANPSNLLLTPKTPTEQPLQQITSTPQQPLQQITLAAQQSHQPKTPEASPVTEKDSAKRQLAEDFENCQSSSTKRARKDDSDDGGDGDVPHHSAASTPSKTPEHSSNTADSSRTATTTAPSGAPPSSSSRRSSHRAYSPQEQETIKQAALAYLDIEAEDTRGSRSSKKAMYREDAEYDSQFSHDFDQVYFLHLRFFLSYFSHETYFSVRTNLQTWMMMMMH